MADRPLLSVEGLTIGFGGPSGPLALDDVSFSLRRGETLSLVGESGSGKTLAARSLLGILPRGAHIRAGHAIFVDRDGASDLLALGDAALRDIRGSRIAMVFQEPMSALSPLHSVGEQVAEAVRLHHGATRAAAAERCIEVFAEVGFPDPDRAYAAYPFQLSGGLRQRAMIAMAMVCRPTLLIADEPTTALDVTTQATVLDLIRRLQAETGMGVLLITHDLGVVANVADTVAVMRAGRVVEAGPVTAVLGAAGHPYTRALMAATPTIPEAPSCRVPTALDTILQVSGLNKTYPGRRLALGRRAPPVTAAIDVGFALERGATLAIVGESGSGKSTIARLALRAEIPDPGSRVVFRGRDGVEIDIGSAGPEALRAFRRRAQMVFQDPFASLSPRMTIRDILTEPLRVHRIGTPAEQRDRAAALMARVGLSPDHLGRFPHAFSGGQRQRISIARALALGPELLVCDEPTSALDVSVQAQVLDLLAELRRELGLSMLFISHNLAVVAGIADHVAVMRRGRIVESAPVDRLFLAPVHPYTQALIAASPVADCEARLDLAAVSLGAGEPETWPERFRVGEHAVPALREIEAGHFVRCAA